MSDTPKTTMFAGLPEANELARDIRDAKRYRALRRVHLEHLDADDYGYACEDWDKQCDVLVAKYMEFDNQGNKVEHTPDSDRAFQYWFRSSLFARDYKHPCWDAWNAARIWFAAGVPPQGEPE